MNGRSYYRLPRRTRRFSKRRIYRRYTKRGYPPKSFISKTLSTNLQAVKCTYNTSICILAGGSTYAFLSSLADYLNMATILTGSPEFVSRLQQYSLYKINGVSFTATRKWMDPIAFGINGTKKGILESTFYNGVEDCFINFYPTISTIGSLGTKVENAEGSFKISAYDTTKQRHYIPFPKNFTNNSNSNGYGSWNSTGSYSSLLGEFAIYNSGEGITMSDQGGLYVWDLEVEVYTTFCNNTGA